jgi:hypothetical protein
VPGQYRRSKEGRGVADLFLFEKIAVTRLRQRRVEDGGPGVRLRMPDGRGDVRLSGDEWDALGGWYRDQVRPSAKRLRLAVWLTLPLIIAFLALVYNVPLLRAAFEWLFDVAAPLVMLFLCGALPLTMATLHALAVQRAIDRVNAALADRPRHGASGLAPPKALNTVELIALVLVGPHLVFATIGTLSPGAFRNTPFTNAHLDAPAVAGLVVLLALGLLRWRRTRQAAAQAGDGGRSLDVVARAHERR